MGPVIWALDAFSDKRDFGVHFKTAQAIATHAPEAEIYPVYVLSEEVFSDRGYSSFLRPGLQPMARRNLEAILNHDAVYPLKRLGHVHQADVILESSADAHMCVSKLLRYASDHGASLIAIGTHARSPLARWFAGSFAQTLMRESPIPLLVAGNFQPDDLHSTDSVIVPTDFSADQRKLFEDLVRYAYDRRLTLHLVQKRTDPLEAWIQNGGHLLGGGWSSLDTRLFTDDGRDEEVSRWLQTAREAGLQTKISTENFGESAAEAIIDYARSLPAASPVIAVMMSPPASRTWLDDSVVRDLIRSSPYPLYVRH